MCLLPHPDTHNQARTTAGTGQSAVTFLQSKLKITYFCHHIIIPSSSLTLTLISISTKDQRWNIFNNHIYKKEVIILSPNCLLGVVLELLWYVLVPTINANHLGAEGIWNLLLWCDMRASLCQPTSEVGVADLLVCPGLITYKLCIQSEWLWWPTTPASSLPGYSRLIHPTTY